MIQDIFRCFIWNWIVWFGFFITIILFGQFIYAPLAVWLISGTWEIPSYEKYYRYLIGCVPSGFFAELGSHLNIGGGFIKNQIKNKNQWGENQWGQTPLISPN